MKQTSRNSSIIYPIAVPLGTALMVLIYRPFNLYPFLDLSAGLFIPNVIILTFFTILILAISRTLLFFKFKKRINSRTNYLLWCLGEIMLSGVVLSIFIGVWEYILLKGIEHSFMTIPIYLSVAIIPYSLTYMAIELYSDKSVTRPEKKKSVSIVKEGLMISFNGTTIESKIDILAEDIIYINSVENYVHIHYMEDDKATSCSIRATMNSIENTVERCKQIRRSHRSYIINIMHLEEVIKDNKGNYFALLKEKTKLPISKKYYDHFIQEVPSWKIKFND